MIVNQSAQQRIVGVSDRIAHSRVPFWKRILDCTLVLLSAPVWLPLGAAIAAWVKLVSPGPALFRQERIGHLGVRFLCLKFRTMKVNADSTVHREHLNHLIASNQPMKKLDAAGDSRLIPGGLWLRTLGVSINFSVKKVYSSDFPPASTSLGRCASPGREGLDKPSSPCSAIPA